VNGLHGEPGALAIVGSNPADPIYNPRGPESVGGTRLSDGPGRLQSVNRKDNELVRVAKRKIKLMDFDDLLAINEQVVSLTKEPHEYSESDGKKLKALLKDVEDRAGNEDFRDAVHDKASLLMFRLASGQHFRAGNRRTALVAGAVFLAKNGFSVSLSDPKLVSVVDKAGMAGASLDDVLDVVERLSVKAAMERKGWEGAAKGLINSSRKTLTEIGS
jgi:prophage maintenance system killer protein